MIRSLCRSPLIALGVALALLSSGCFRGGGRLFSAMAWTAILTSAIVSSHAPPRDEMSDAPPAPRPGYSWQPGYWAPYEGHWVWVPGRFIRNQPGYLWNPAHWVEDPGGRWRLVPGEWIPVGRGSPGQQAAPGAPGANPQDEEGDDDDEAPPPPPRE